MNLISNIVNAIKGTIEAGFEYINDVIDVFKEIYDLILSFINFIPSPYNTMTLITAGVFFGIMIWRIFKK